MNNETSDAIALLTAQNSVLQLAVAALIDRHHAPEEVEQLFCAKLALMHANLAAGGLPATQTSLLRETAERFLSQLAWRDAPPPPRR